MSKFKKATSWCASLFLIVSLALAALVALGVDLSAIAEIGNVLIWIAGG